MSPDAEPDSFIEFFGWPERAPRFTAVRGRHVIPLVGTVRHDKKWHSARSTLRFRPAGETEWQVFPAHWTAPQAILAAQAPAEARILIEWCTSGAERQPGQQERR